MHWQIAFQFFIIKVMTRGPEASGTIERPDFKERAIKLGRRVLIKDKIFIAFSGSPQHHHLENQLVIPVLADSRATAKKVIH